MLIRARLRNDSGFTLIELLISIVILGIIAVPLSNVVIGYLLNSTTTSARLSESHDEQIANAYWQQDVASIGVRGDYDPAAGTFPLMQSVGITFPCTLPAGSTTVTTLAWNQYDSSGTPTQISVAYVTKPAGAVGQLQLLRVSCTGNTPGTVPDSTATVAHYLNAVPTISSAGDPNIPTSMSMQLSVQNLTDKGQPYTVT